jgi:hypothetical protein
MESSLNPVDDAVDEQNMAGPDNRCAIRVNGLHPKKHDSFSQRDDGQVNQAIGAEVRFSCPLRRKAYDPREEREALGAASGRHFT